MSGRSIRARSYQGQVAVVTGASAGLGRQFAEDLAQRGATVVGIARRRVLLDDVEATMQTHSPASTTIVCDVADEPRLLEILAKVEADLGPVDILINNAGIDRLVPIGNGDAGATREIFAVNFFAAASATWAVLPQMLARRRGTIVNVSSDAARAPEPRQAPYSGSKAALSAFTEALAHEIAGSGVHLHLLYPGWVPTAMNRSLAEAGVPEPPKSVRRTAEQVSTLLLDRMGGRRIEINATRLPQLVPVVRALAPVGYQKAMQRLAARHR